jgi:hypothetical protein
MRCWVRAPYKVIQNYDSKEKIRQVNPKIGLHFWLELWVVYNTRNVSEQAGELILSFQLTLQLLKSL